MILKKEHWSLKLILILILFISFSLSLRAEGNLPYADDRPIHFGFILGTNFAGFSVLANEDQPHDESWSVANVSRLQPGFTAGFIADLRLARYLNLRFTPLVFFTERELTYKKIVGNQIDTESIFSIPLALPLYLKYSAERVGNYRPYLIAGGGVYIDFYRNKEKNILLKPFDVYIDFGVGCDLYFSFFKLAPELKFSIGFNNMLTPVAERDPGGYDPKFTNLLSRLTTKMITLSFNFE